MIEISNQLFFFPFLLPYFCYTFCFTDADYTDDIALLANAPAQAKTLLHSLERAAAGISLHVNAHKTEYICFNQTGDISILNSSSLKLVDKFPYLGSSVSSTEIDINTQLAKAWIGYQSYGSQIRPIKRSTVFFKQQLCWYCYMDTLRLNIWRKSLTATT